MPVITAAGEEAQIDYGYLGKFNREGKAVKVWVFCMVLSHSRYAFYSLATEQTAQSFVYSHRQAFEFFGGAPRTVKIDNLVPVYLKQIFTRRNFNNFILAFWIIMV